MELTQSLLPAHEPGVRQHDDDVEGDGGDSEADGPSHQEHVGAQDYIRA